MKTKTLTQSVITAFGLLALTLNSHAQTVTNPVPNQVISWNYDNNSTVNPEDLAGLAPATNWVDTYLNNITVGLPDNTGTATTLNLAYSSYNSYSVGGHPGYDANGTANREILNGFLNAGPAAWSPPVTNTYVALTNIPYARYDVIVYFNSDTSGRHASIDNGGSTYYFSAMGSPSVNGANALFVPTTQTNSAIFPSADFAFFPGMTNANAVFTETPKSGNDQWLGIAAFQVIQSSNAYVVYGPSPASQIVPVGQPASFSVMAGGLNPQYQWQHAGTNVLNATNATYAITTTALGQDGNYGVIVSNSFGSVTSAVATLTFYTPKTVAWDGNGSTWDTSSLFWTVDGGASTTFYTESDNVRFGPLGAAQSYVTLNSTFNPGSITVSNASYTFVGGGLSGTGSLHVQNNGTFILDTADTRTGPTLIDSGSTLQLDNGDTAGSLGSGALTNNGALLFNAGGDDAFGYPVYGTGSITNLSSAGTITLGNNIQGNYLVQAGDGTLLLQGSNSLSGGFVVNNGTVWARGAGCLGTSPILLSGGELQLYFNIDFAGSTMNLAGGLLHGGVGGANTYEGIVSLTADSDIEVDSGNSFTLANPAGLNGGNYNPTIIGGGTLILAGTNNTWASLSIAAGTVQIGNGGANASTGPTAIADYAGLAFNTSGYLLVTNEIDGSGTVAQNGSGTVNLASTANTYSGLTTVNSGTLLVNGVILYGGVQVNSGILGGTGTVNSAVSILPGATLAPGAGGVGPLTINSDLTLGGNLAIDVNKSLSPSNDLTVVTGALSNTNSGVVTVNNLGPALKAGDTFTLFSQPVSGGQLLTVSGGGAVWVNNLASDGSITVLSASVPQPVFETLSVANGNIVANGTDGPAGGTYYLLSSTNLATPLANWVPVSTNVFDASGNFSLTNGIGSEPQKFYLLKLQ